MLRLGVTLACAGWLSVATLTAPFAQAADLPQIRSRGVLRVLVVDGAPAFFALKPGDPPGLEREILESFARLQRVRLEVVEVPSWDDLLPALIEGKGDLIAGAVTATEGRKQVIAFTAEVFPTRDIVMTRAPHRVVRSLAELREERVGTIRGTSLEDNIRAAGVPRQNIDNSVPPADLPKALHDGRVTAIVDGVEQALRYKRADPAVQLGLFVGPPQSLAFGVTKQAEQLLQALNEHVGQVRRSPVWSRLVVSYFGDEALTVLKKARGEAN